jgi:hypothetical protein
MVPEPDVVADRRVVFDLLEDLRAAWQRILNDYAAGHTSAGHLPTERGGVRYVDGWMACHNFFKLALDHLVREADLHGEAAAQLYLGAGETFRRAMEARAAQVRAAAKAVEHGHG